MLTIFWFHYSALVSGIICEEKKKESPFFMLVRNKYIKLQIDLTV